MTLDDRDGRRTKSSDQWSGLLLTATEEAETDARLWQRDKRAREMCSPFSVPVIQGSVYQRPIKGTKFGDLRF